MTTSQNSDFVRIKNVEDTALPGTQLEIPFDAPSLPPPPPFIEDTWTELELVPYPPINWRAWTLGLLAGLGLGLLIASRELQDFVSQTLNSLTPWK